MAQLKLGKKVAKKLKGRLADLQAASSVKELVAGRQRSLDGKSIALDLCDGFYLVIRPNHTIGPLAKSQTVDWSRVERVKIQLIEPKAVSS